MAETLCPYFGKCGGCLYQDRSYEEELSLKEDQIRELLQTGLGLSPHIFSAVVPSSNPYHYRSRLDLTFKRIRGRMELGSNGLGTQQMVAVESCAIARSETSDFLPELKELAAKRLPENYRGANLVVKTGGDGKIRWGGIGRRSLRLPESEYFWTEIEGKKIFYSLDCFFQANLGILPRLMSTLRSLLRLNSETVLLDLYAGVGLFWVVFAHEVKQVFAIEECESSVQVADFNRRYHNLSHVVLKQGRIEDSLDEIMQSLSETQKAGIVDPPRKGLSPEALQKLVKAHSINPLVYISCQPASLARDLEEFIQNGWQIDQIIPFDFFPRTRHLEVVVRLHHGTI